MTRKLFLLLLLLSSNYIKPYSQRLTYRNTKVDSNTFIENRKILNSLNTENFQKKIFQNGTTSIPYRFLSPEKITKKEKYPLVITFHNSTRIGTDNEKQLEPLARIWLRSDIVLKYPCYVIAPQFPTRSSVYETDRDNVLVSKPSKEVHDLLSLINKVKRDNPNINTNRIYLVIF